MVQISLFCLFSYSVFSFSGSDLRQPYGLTLLHDKFFWTDWNTDGVYRADVNTGANIVLMTGDLGQPMDIHAYSAIPKQREFKV